MLAPSVGSHRGWLALKASTHARSRTRTVRYPLHIALLLRRHHV